MRNMLLAIILISTFLTACSKWNVIQQSEVDFFVTTAGFSDKNNGITVGYAGECHYTSDGGKSWSYADNRSWCRFGLEMVDNNVAIHCGNAGQVGFSKDGGKSWKLGTNFGEMEPNQCRYLSFPDIKTGWIASPKRLASTTDEGYTWNELTLPAGIGPILAIDTWSSKEGCVLDNKYDLYFTADGGKTWQKQKMPADKKGINRIISMAPNTVMRFMDRNRGIIIVQVMEKEETKLIEMSTLDGGKTWTEEEIPVKVLENNTLFLARDGKTLTVYNAANGIMLIRKNGT